MMRWAIVSVLLGIASGAGAQAGEWVTVLAGKGAPDSTASLRQIGDGGPAIEAQLVNPFDAVSDGQGNVYVLDTSQQRVRRVDVQGMIATVAGTGRYGFSDGGGRAVEAFFADPMGLALDASGNLYVADTFNHRIRVVEAQGRIRTVAGTGNRGFGGDGGPAALAHLANPSGLALGPDGALYVADQGNHRVRRIDPSGMMHTVAGTGDRGFGGDGGPAIEAPLSDPSGVALGPDGAIYVADWGSHRVRRIDPSGVIHTVAGTGTPGFSGDGGPAIEAQLLIPSRVAVDAQGQVYIADRGNSRIRRVDAGGRIVSVLAAVGWKRPFGVSVDLQGRLLVADTENHLVRVVARPERRVSLVRDVSHIQGDGADAVRLLASLSDGALGIPVAFRILSGQGVLPGSSAQTSGGLAGVQFVSQWPGRVAIEARVEGALPVAAEVDVRPVRVLDITVDRVRIAANGDDVARVRAMVRDGNGDAVAANVAFVVAAGEGMLEIVDGAAQIRATESGMIEVVAHAPGAFPASIAIFAQGPLPHQIADAYEPDNRADQAGLLGREAQAHTFHTPGDVDWIAVPVRPGYAVQICAEGDVPVRAVSGNDAFDLPGEVFASGPEADTLRVALSHGAGGVGAYVLRVVERRTAQLALEVSPSVLVADGEEAVDVVVAVLDRFGARDTGDDTTQVFFAVADGPGEIGEAVVGVRKGEGRARLRSTRPGSIIVEAYAQGIPAAQIGIEALPALMLQADLVPGQDASVALVAMAGVKGATGVQVRLAYDGDGLIFHAFEPVGLLLGAAPIVVVGDGALEINAVLLDGQIAEDGGLLGRVRFHAAGAQPRTVAIVKGQYGLPSGIFPFGIGAKTGRAQVRADDFGQWLYFQQAFGAVKGDIRYQAVWDIDADGVIGFGDFLKWLGQ